MSIIAILCGSATRRAEGGMSRGASRRMTLLPFVKALEGLQLVVRSRDWMLHLSVFV